MECLAVLGLNGCRGDDDNRGSTKASLKIHRRNANPAAVKYGNPDPAQLHTKALFGRASCSLRDQSP